MNWDALAAVGEMLGSVAVLVTLGYLTLQVRHARLEARRALGQDRLEGNHRLLELEMQEANFGLRAKASAAFGMEPFPVVAEIMERAELTYEEAFRVFNVDVVGWNYRVHTITHIDELPAGERELFDGATYIRYSRGVSQFVYETAFKPQASPEIVDYIDTLLAQPRSTPGQ